MHRFMFLSETWLDLIKSIRIKEDILFDSVFIGKVFFHSVIKFAVYSGKFEVDGFLGS